MTTALRSYDRVTTFTADGVLFDMDGTLTDSIAAVEAAWGAKAVELGLQPSIVIAATHGRRASDNLLDLIPSLKREQLDQEVDRFEKSILAFADTPPQSRRSSQCISPHRTSSGQSSLGLPTPDDCMTKLVRGPLEASTIRSETIAFTDPFSSSLGSQPQLVEESPFGPETESDDEIVDMQVRILPGVRQLIDSLPKDRYAIATSGAKTYCHGCLQRTQITIPIVCVTADDPRLMRGKPFPDPFLLAAQDLGVDPARAVIFEDSPSGIKAAVAAGSVVIAVCTSHKREQIDQLGAQYVIDTMEQVKVEPDVSGSLRFTVRF